MRDVTTEMRDLHVSVIHAGMSRLCVSYVVIIACRISSSSVHEQEILLVHKVTVRKVSCTCRNHDGPCSKRARSRMRQPYRVGALLDVGSGTLLHGGGGVSPARCGQALALIDAGGSALLHGGGGSAMGCSMEAAMGVVGSGSIVASRSPHA
jgi:hypothetical protein